VLVEVSVEVGVAVGVAVAVGVGVDKIAAEYATMLPQVRVHVPLSRVGLIRGTI
jgi:hypothetical protein